MIYTITFNPSLDYFINLDTKLIEGKIYKTDENVLFAGGKGINISIILSTLHIPSKAIMFLGGCVGDMIAKQLDQFVDIEVCKIPINQDSRINVKIKAQEETAFNAIGPSVSESDKQKLLNELTNVTENDCVVISGSYCKGVDSTFVQEIAKLVKEKHGILITDIPNLTLNDYKLIQPLLIKPNLEELEYIFNTKITKENYREYVDQLNEIGVENVLVSLGSQGSYYSNRYESYITNGPSVNVISTVGCGDSMLAYVIASMVNNLPTSECLKYGEAAGRDKASRIGLANKESVDQMIQQIKVERVR